MANTFTKIGDTVTVGSGGAASIDFTLIPSTYTDLQLLLSVRTATATYQIDQLKLLFNASSASDYNYKDLLGSGPAGVTSSGASSQGYLYFGNAPRPQATANTFSNVSLYIPNYALSTNKSSLTDSVAVSNGSGDYWYLRLNAGLWNKTNAINQITVYSGDSGGFSQYSTATLYGIKNS